MVLAPPGTQASPQKGVPVSLGEVYPACLPPSGPPIDSGRFVRGLIRGCCERAILLKSLFLKAFLEGLGTDKDAPYNTSQVGPLISVINYFIAIYPVT